MLNFRVQTFLCACKHMNFTSAAAELGISQPAVSQHIHHLEKDYGIKLFQYEGKKLSLTEEGKLMLSAVQTINNDEHILRQRIKAMQEKEHMYRFGASYTIGNYLILDKLADLLHAHPNYNIHMSIGDTSTLLEAIDEGQIDFAIVEGFFDHSKYETLPFLTERLFCVCGKEYEIPNEVRIEELFAHRIISRSKGGGSRELLDKALATVNASISSFVTEVLVGTPYAVKELAVRNCGIAFIYESVVKRELAEGTLRRIKIQNFHPFFNFTFLWKSGSMYRDDFISMYKQLAVKKAVPTEAP